MHNEARTQVLIFFVSSPFFPRFLGQFRGEMITALWDHLNFLVQLWICDFHPFEDPDFLSPGQTPRCEKPDREEKIKTKKADGNHFYSGRPKKNPVANAEGARKMSSLNRSGEVCPIVPRNG